LWLGIFPTPSADSPGGIAPQGSFEYKRSVPDPVAEAQELLVDTIETFEKLEVIRALARKAPQPTSQLVDDLGLPIDVARDTLRALSAQHILIEQPGGWIINPNGARHDAVLALVQLYDTDRVGVLNRMTKIALERIRADAARTFADAFVLRSRKKEEDE
jgi:hypothetical protein